MTPDLPLPLPLPLPLDELPTPALLVHRARMDANLRAMAGSIGAAGVALRPHLKTSKCVAVARRQLAHGAIGFTCATPAEVALLQDAGVQDVLWAHQPVGPAKVAFAVKALARGGLTLALDSMETAEPVSTAAAEAGVTVPFVLEVDTGMHRAGVDPDRAVKTAAALTALPALELRGVLTHEGHLAAHGSDRAALEAAGLDAGRTLV
ncbi:MAG: alanine racemase, partial [Spirillospora sp.]